MSKKTSYLIVSILWLYIAKGGFCSDLSCRRVHNPVQKELNPNDTNMDNWSPESVKKAVGLALSGDSKVERVIDVLSRIGRATYSKPYQYDIAYAAMSGLTKIGEKLPEYRQAVIDALESFKKGRGPVASRIKGLASQFGDPNKAYLWRVEDAELWVYNRAVYSQEYLQLCDKKRNGVISDEDFERQSLILKIEHAKDYYFETSDVDLYAELSSAIDILLNSLQIDDVYNALLISAENMDGWSPESVKKAVGLALSGDSKVERVIDVLSRIGRATYSKPYQYDIAYAAMSGLTKIGEKLPEYRQAVIDALESFKKGRGPVASRIKGLASQFGDPNKAYLWRVEDAELGVYKKAKEHQDYLMHIGNSIKF